MSEQIKSFEEAVNGVYGDILSPENKKKDVKIGVITCGYFEYWRMYPENLEKNVKSDMKKIVDKLKEKYDNIVYPEFVDTLDSADRAGKELAKEQVDMLIVIGGTYVADFISLHAINHVKNVPLLLFSTQLVGIELTIEQQLVIMFALMLTSKGVAGVPRASLIVLAGTLTSFNYPSLGVALLLGIDQILDMGRTAVNLIGNCVATVVIARWENVFDYNKMNEFLKLKNIKTNTFGKVNNDVSFQTDFCKK